MMSFTVTGMSCNPCAQRITRAVNALDPKATVHVDLATKQVEIDSALPPDKFQAAINEAGYVAEPQ
jgi:copper chaperone